MNIPQDTFNKMVTAFLILFFSAMYLTGFIINKQPDWQLLLGFIVPTLNQIVHQITATNVQTTQVHADTEKEVAKIQANGITPGRVQTPGH